MKGRQWWWNFRQLGMRFLRPGIYPMLPSSFHRSSLLWPNRQTDSEEIQSFSSCSTYSCERGTRVNLAPNISSEKVDVAILSVGHKSPPPMSESSHPLEETREKNWKKKKFFFKKETSALHRTLQRPFHEEGFDRYEDRSYSSRSLDGPTSCLNRSYSPAHHYYCRTFSHKLLA